MTDTNRELVPGSWSLVRRERERCMTIVLNACCILP